MGLGTTCFPAHQRSGKALSSSMAGSWVAPRVHACGTQVNCPLPSSLSASSLRWTLEPVLEPILTLLPQVMALLSAQTDPPWQARDPRRLQRHPPKPCSRGTTWGSLAWDHCDQPGNGNGIYLLSTRWAPASQEDVPASGHPPLGAKGCPSTTGPLHRSCMLATACQCCLQLCSDVADSSTNSWGWQTVSLTFSQCPSPPSTGGGID